MALYVPFLFVLREVLGPTWTDHDGADKSSRAAAGVDNAAARKIGVTVALIVADCEPTAGIPAPVHDDRIHPSGQDDAVNNVRLRRVRLGRSTSCQVRICDSKSALMARSTVAHGAAASNF